MKSSNEERSTINHAVRYDQFGGRNVLYIAELPVPVPGAGQLLIRVKATGINPGEAGIREGKLAQVYPSTFPSGEGSDLAGIVEAMGEGINNFKPGDEIIGFSHQRNSHAEYVVIDQKHAITKPAGISWEQAGGLFVAGTTAYAAIEAISLKEGDVVVISGATGGVGSVAVQLAVNKGAQVYGFASERNHDWLKKHNVIPVAYGDDNKAALLEALAGKKPNAFFDAFGKGYVDLAIDLGIPKDRINTIIDFQAAHKYGVKTDGNAKGASAEVLQKLTDMIVDGKLDFPVSKTYPLTEVKVAFEELEKGHTHGKIVLIP